MIKDQDRLLWYSLLMLLMKPPSFQNIYIVSLADPNYTPSSLKNRGDVFQSWVFLCTEFSRGSFHTLEALSTFDDKRRQDRFFFSFSIWLFFLT